MKLQIVSTILAGAESKAWLADLTAQIDRLEKLVDTRLETGNNDDLPLQDGGLDDLPLQDGGLDDLPLQDGGLDDSEDEEQDEIDVSSVRKGRTKKVSLEDVNDACKAKVAAIAKENECTGKEARTKVLMLLKRKFDVTSVSELKPEQYADVLKVMA